MKKIVLCVATIGLALSGFGCAHNAIVGDGGMRSDEFFGDVGITGDGGNVTILRGSKVPKLSFIGHDNTVTVDDGVWIGSIEFWGKHNTVSVPADLTFRTTQIGTDNQILRRPRERKPVEGAPAQEELLPTTPRSEDVLIQPETDDWSRPAEPAEVG